MSTNIFYGNSSVASSICWNINKKSSENLRHNFRSNLQNTPPLGFSRNTHRVLVWTLDVIKVWVTAWDILVLILKKIFEDDYSIFKFSMVFWVKCFKYTRLIPFQTFSSVSKNKYKEHIIWLILSSQSKFQPPNPSIKAG
jgi:hypothetical protein